MAGSAATDGHRRKASVTALGTLLSITEPSSRGGVGAIGRSFKLEPRWPKRFPRVEITPDPVG